VTVAVAAVFVLQIELVAVAEVTGLLFNSWRTATGQMVEPTMSAVRVAAWKV
jgi:hypothetical protein